MSFMKKLGPAAVAAAFVTLAPLSAMAADGAASNEFDVKMMAALGAGIAIAVGVLGATLSQGRGAAAALEGISRNPGAAARIQTPMILGLALIESLALLAFVIAFFLQGIAAK
jgi:F-type H+-transporting ATPase subunit c